ncbi:hypothetical protein ACFX16_045915 [Malus domestica]
MRAARMPPAPDPEMISKKLEMVALGSPDLRRREDSRCARALVARIPYVASTASMERIQTFPVNCLLECVWLRGVNRPAELGSEKKS